MSTQSPIDVVRTLYRLFGEGRLEETFELMSPEVVLHEPGDAELIPWAGEFVGHEGLRRFYGGLASALSEISIDPASLRLVPIGADEVLALGTERATGAATGKSYESRSAWHWTVREGWITGLTAFHDTAAMEAALRP
ncbi:MAG: nuclear transport factor 2 family protein [Gemmatimonadales bacterium]